MISVLKLRLSKAPLLLALLLAAPAHAGNKIGNVTATGPLSFGRFVANTGGTIIISPLGGPASYSGVLGLPGGAPAAASFSLTESGTGKSLNFGTITLPSTATMTSGAGATMTLSNFVSDPAGSVFGTGRTTVLVGATLTVAPNQAPGNYSGTFQVTVNYQ